MPDEKEKAIAKDQEIIQPVGGTKGELSEKDLDKASGGTKQGKSDPLIPQA